MKYHAFMFWGKLRATSEFSVIDEKANEIFNDMACKITHIGYDSHKYDSKVYRKYNRVNKKLINLNENLSQISLFNLAYTGKQSDELWNYDIQLDFLNNNYREIDNFDLNEYRDTCQLSLRKEYLTREFKLNVLPKLKVLADYILELEEYHHYTCKSLSKISAYGFDKHIKSNSRIPNILEREIYK